jgi:hypothetical protein
MSNIKREGGMFRNIKGFFGGAGRYIKNATRTPRVMLTKRVLGGRNMFMGARPNRNTEGGPIYSGSQRARLIKSLNAKTNASGKKVYPGIAHAYYREAPVTTLTDFVLWLNKKSGKTQPRISFIPIQTVVKEAYVAKLTKNEANKKVINNKRTRNAQTLRNLNKNLYSANNENINSVFNKFPIKNLIRYGNWKKSRSFIRNKSLKTYIKNVVNHGMGFGSENVKNRNRSNDPVKNLALALMYRQVFNQAKNSVARKSRNAAKAKNNAIRAKRMKAIQQLELNRVAPTNRTQTQEARRRQLEQQSNGRNPLRRFRSELNATSSFVPIVNQSANQAPRSVQQVVQNQQAQRQAIQRRFNNAKNIAKEREKAKLELVEFRRKQAKQKREFGNMRRRTANLSQMGGSVISNKDERQLQNLKAEMERNGSQNTSMMGGGNNKSMPLQTAFTRTGLGNKLPFGGSGMAMGVAPRRGTLPPIGQRGRL